MGLLRDWHYIEKAVEIPALSEMIRDALIRALFVRDDRVLPRDLVADLSRVPPVTVKVKDDGEVRKLVRVLNGQESTLSLGLSAEDYHFFRTQLGVGRTREFGVVPRPRTLLTYDWIVPEQRGVQLDFSGYADIEFAEEGHRAIAQVGATWKALYDAATAKGHSVPFVPTVPLDFAVGDALVGDAPFASYRGEFGSFVNAVRTISAFGHRARLGFEEVANNGTAYDLLHAVIPLAAEFFIPVAVAVRLEAKPATRKTLTYAFDDGAKLAAALDKLCRTGQGIERPSPPRWPLEPPRRAPRRRRRQSTPRWPDSSRRVPKPRVRSTRPRTHTGRRQRASRARSSSARCAFRRRPSVTSQRACVRSETSPPRRRASTRAFERPGPCPCSRSSRRRRTARSSTTCRKACGRSCPRSPEASSRPVSRTSGRRSRIFASAWRSCDPLS